MKRSFHFLFIILFLTASATSQSIPAKRTGDASADPRVLLVVTHPDDEYEMAGTVYRITKELSGRVDQLITDGEAGYHYTSLAEQYYGVKLTYESDGLRGPARRTDSRRRTPLVFERKR